MCHTTKARFLVLFGLAVSSLPSRAFGARPVEPFPMNREQLYLVFDPRLRGVGDNCELQLHSFQRHPANPVLTPQFPWEKTGMRLGGTVLWEPDSGLFKMWYFAGTGKRYLGYAESKDGLRWTRPRLGLYEIEGSKDNNICFVGVYTPVVYRDLEAADPAKRYVMWALQTRDSPDRVKANYSAYRFYSADGKRWTRSSKTPAFPGHPAKYKPAYPGQPDRQLVDGVGGDHSYTYWVPPLKKFVCFHRVEPPNPKPPPGVAPGRAATRRHFARFESGDGVTWNTDRPTWAFVPDEKDDLHDPYLQFYGLGFHPVGDFYLATTMLYHSSAKNDHLQVGLAYSTDTIHWHRPFRGQYLLPHGAEGEWDWGQTRQAVNIVEKDDLWWLYYAGTPHTHYDTTVPGNYSAFGLAQLPKGRVVSARCWRKKGSWTLGPVRLPGKRLFLNARVYDELRVALLDERGRPIPGYEKKIRLADATQLPVAWDAGDLSALKGRPVKLRFELNNAEIFGFICR